ncbi:unnamed protein product, partial [Allacma fusca]
MKKHVGEKHNKSLQVA